jgi:hypothetical protein
MHMKKTAHFSILLLLLFTIACSGPGKLMNEWVGKTKEQLLKTWGQPERVVNNGTNGEILIYSAKADVLEILPAISVTTEGDGYTKADPRTQRMYHLTKLKLFYINAAGVIYAWKVQDV